MISDPKSIATGILALAALVAAGGLNAALRDRDVAAADSANVEAPAVAAEQAFGGLRRLAAGLIWVGVYSDWHRRDRAAMTAGMEWAVQLDPGVMLYWLDGARMMAYDVPAWHRGSIRSADELKSLRREQLERSMNWLDRAWAEHPQRAAIPIEKAVQQWSVARDAAAAERALAAAQGCGDAPYFVARVRAEMLVRLGRRGEALQLLRRELPRLSPDDPRAARTLVEQRIRELAGTENRPNGI